MQNFIEINSRESRHIFVYKCLGVDGSFNQLNLSSDPFQKFDFSTQILVKCVVRMIGREIRGSFLILSLAFVIRAFAHVPDSNFQIFCFREINKYGYVSNKAETELCTHIIYHSIKWSKYDRLHFVDDWPGFNGQYGSQVADYKAKGIKTMAQIVQMDDSVMLYSKCRARFVKNSVYFLRKHNLDGLHVLYTPSRSDLKIGFVKLLSELHQAYKPLGLYVSILLLGITYNDVDNGYNVTALANSTDWIRIELTSVRDETATGNKNTHTVC